MATPYLSESIRGGATAAVDSQKPGDLQKALSATLKGATGGVFVPGDAGLAGIGAGQTYGGTSESTFKAGEAYVTATIHSKTS